MAGLWGAGDYIFVLARYLGCIIGRWLLCSGGCLITQVSLYQYQYTTGIANSLFALCRPGRPLSMPGKAVDIWGVHEHHRGTFNYGVGECIYL